MNFIVCKVFSKQFLPCPETFPDLFVDILSRDDSVHIEKKELTDTVNFKRFKNNVFV